MKAPTAAATITSAIVEPRGRYMLPPVMLPSRLCLEASMAHSQPSEELSTFRTPYRFKQTHVYVSRKRGLFPGMFLQQPVEVIILPLGRRLAPNHIFEGLS